MISRANKWRKEVRPYGVFKRNESQKGALSFQLTAPKIPGEFLDRIVIRFRKDPSKEAAFQIFYDIETQEYELYEPVQKRSKTSVHFIRNHRLETEKTLMMDIHSHGMMEAFFLELMIGTKKEYSFIWFSVISIVLLPVLS